MSLVGEKCARCGVRTRHEVEGGATMAKGVAHMIVIDRYPSCKDVWLDRGELEKSPPG